MRNTRVAVVVCAVGIISIVMFKYAVEYYTRISCKVKSKFRKEAHGVVNYLMNAVGWDKPFVESVFNYDDSRVYRCNCGDEWCEVAVVSGEFRVLKSWVEYPETIGLDREW